MMKRMAVAATFLFTVYVMLAGKGQAGRNTHPAWSPDGRYLSCFSSIGTDSPTLVIHDLENGTDREVAIQSQEILRRGLQHRFKPAWTADSSGISTLGVARAEDAQHLFKIDVQSGEVSKVHSTDSDHFITDHRWSRDGKILFYLKNELEAWDVTITAVEIESGAETDLYRAANLEMITNVALSPDGKELVFRSTDTKNTSRRDILKTISTRGGEPRVLLDEEVKRTTT